MATVGSKQEAEKRLWEWLRELPNTITRNINLKNIEGPYSSLYSSLTGMGKSSTFYVINRSVRFEISEDGTVHMLIE